MAQEILALLLMNNANTTSLTNYVSLLQLNVNEKPRSAYIFGAITWAIGSLPEPSKLGLFSRFLFHKLSWYSKLNCTYIDEI